jgi:hypothetical protein
VPRGAIESSERHGQRATDDLELAAHVDVAARQGNGSDDVIGASDPQAAPPASSDQCRHARLDAILAGTTAANRIALQIAGRTSPDAIFGFGLQASASGNTQANSVSDDTPLRPSR